MAYYTQEHSALRHVRYGIFWSIYGFDRVRLLSSFGNLCLKKRIP